MPTKKRFSGERTFYSALKLLLFLISFSLGVSLSSPVAAWTSSRLNAITLNSTNSRVINLKFIKNSKKHFLTL